MQLDFTFVREVRVLGRMKSRAKELNTEERYSWSFYEARISLEVDT